MISKLLCAIDRIQRNDEIKLDIIYGTLLCKLDIIYGTLFLYIF